MSLNMSGWPYLDISEQLYNDPYMQVTNLPLVGMPLVFTAGSLLLDQHRVHPGNVTTGRPLGAHWWPASGYHKRTTGVVSSGPPAGHYRIACKDVVI